MKNPRLSVKKLCKSFFTPVLKNVDLAVSPGEIHGIVGENGAGKTTFINILMGILPKDHGEIRLDGVIHDPSSPGDAYVAGVSYVAQELSVIGTLTVAENIALRNLPSKNSVIQKAKLHEKAGRLLEVAGLSHITPNLQAGKLSLAECQLLEFAKSLANGSRVLALDEPTSSLTAPQAERLHEVIKELAAKGTSIIYVSHRLTDVLNISNNVSVMRDGQVITTAPADTFSVTDLMQRMSGQNDSRHTSTPQKPRKTEPVLDIDRITTSDLPNALSFTCHTGEIVGLAGLAGSGKSELLQALFGLVPLTGGSVSRKTKSGKLPIKNATQAVRTGIGYLGEDRQSMGLFSGLSVLTNITLPGLFKVVSPRGIVNNAEEELAGNGLVEKLAIRSEGLHQNIDQLSGGNQQKALIARWIHCDSDILLFDEPTRGVDVGTKTAIYKLFFEMQEKGKTILVASSEIEELMTICSHILVLSKRKLAGVFERGQWSETGILNAAFQEHTSDLSGTMSPEPKRRDLTSNR